MNVVDTYARSVVAGEVPAGKTAVIYALCDTRDADPVRQVRYIGQTSASLQRRFLHHVCQARRGGMTYRERWMRSVWAANGDVVAKVLAVVPIERWAEVERDTIALYRSLGARLTNATDGGEGMPNPSAETRQKLRAAFLGKPLSAEHRRKIGIANIGNSPSAKQREMSRAAFTGRRLSAETRAKMSAARKGRRHTPEHSAKISAAKKAYYANVRAGAR